MVSAAGLAQRVRKSELPLLVLTMPGNTGCITLNSSRWGHSRWGQSKVRSVRKTLLWPQ